MKPTPETIAESFYDSPPGYEVVSGEFARRLERERDEAREQVDALKATASSRLTSLSAAREERDEARGQRDMLAAALINCMPFISGEGCGEYSDAKLALQSLNQPEP